MDIPTMIKQAATPGSRTFLIPCLVVWLTLRYVWPGRRGVGRGWLLTIVAVYFVLAIPWVAEALADRLIASPLNAPVASDALDTLIVFDGDNRVGRVRQAEHVYVRSQPRVVCVLGAEWVAGALVELGIPKNRIIHDSTTTTTRAQIAWVQHYLNASGSNRTAVVASRLQMPRVAALTKAAGLSLVLVASPIDAEPPTKGVWHFVPTYLALRVSRDALYEHAALAYYTWRGWIEPT